MNKFCVITNRDKDSDLSVTNRIIKYLEAHGKMAVVAKDSYDGTRFTDPESIPKQTECVIVIGGDGTIIHAAHELTKNCIPILGINLGTLGFLAEIETTEVEEAFDKIFAGDYFVEKRMMLCAEYVSSKDQSTNGLKMKEAAALNDIVIARSGFSRIICVRIYVNGSAVSEYRGDGVIISTPTGSTGYNLSAGGPIIVPDTELIVITPICPHSLNARSIVVASTDVVEVEIMESKKTQTEEAIATIDGDTAFDLSAHDRIKITKSKEKTQLIRMKQQSFFDTLRSKIQAE